MGFKLPTCEKGLARAPSCQVVDDEVRVSMVFFATVVSLPKKEKLQHPHEAQLHCKVLSHTVPYSIMILHEEFLCAADEHVDIEVINPLSADGTLLHILL